MLSGLPCTRSIAAAPPLDHYWLCTTAAGVSSRVAATVAELDLPSVAELPSQQSTSSTRPAEQEQQQDEKFNW